VVAGDYQARQGARARQTRAAPAGRPRPSHAPSSAAYARGPRLPRRIPQVLGRAFRCFGAVPRRQQRGRARHARQKVMANTTEMSDTVLRITRVFKASAARVFKACIDPTELRQWWSPAGYVFTDITIDEKTGYGRRYTMVGPSGDRYVWDIVYS